MNMGPEHGSDLYWSSLSFSSKGCHLQKGPLHRFAHGLEYICDVEAPAPKKKGGRGRRKKEIAR